MRFGEINEDTDEQILRTLNKYFLGTENVIVNHGKVSSQQSLERKLFVKFEILPVMFGNIGGSFIVGNSGLTTLYGSPTSVIGNFNAIDNNLTNLIHGPKRVGLTYNVMENELESLDGLPEECSTIMFNYHVNLELLRLFTIKGLTRIVIRGIPDVVDETLSEIANNKSLNTQQKILTAKKEFIKAGYESNARL